MAVCIEQFKARLSDTVRLACRGEDAAGADPCRHVYTVPWTISMPLTAEPNYEMVEYACHEGNYAVPNALSEPSMPETRRRRSSS